jgi:predicted nuclease of predicted toxin-antitoxin system
MRKIKILIDMNLSPLWAKFFSESGIEAQHWSSIGLAYAPDSEIFMHAQQNDFVIFTHDLDFGAILAASNNEKPSVVQLRDEDIFPNEENIKVLCTIFQQFENELATGVLITINKQRTKVRLLPIKR